MRSTPTPTVKSPSSCSTPSGSRSSGLIALATAESGVPAADLGGVIVAAASVFMAYEGFQLLTYDYDDIDDPTRTLRRGVLGAVVVVIGVYVVVALGAASLVGAGAIVEQKEVALAAAGEEALGGRAGGSVDRCRFGGGLRHQRHPLRHRPPGPPGGRRRRASVCGGVGERRRHP